MLCCGHRVSEEGKTAVCRDGGCTLATAGKEVGSMMVSRAAQGLEVAMLSVQSGDSGANILAPPNKEEE